MSEWGAAQRQNLLAPRLGVRARVHVLPSLLLLCDLGGHFTDGTCLLICKVGLGKWGPIIHRDSFGMVEAMDVKLTGRL